MRTRLCQLHKGPFGYALPGRSWPGTVPTLLKISKKRQARTGSDALPPVTERGLIGTNGDPMREIKCSGLDFHKRYIIDMKKTMCVGQLEVASFFLFDKWDLYFQILSLCCM